MPLTFSFGVMPSGVCAVNRDPEFGRHRADGYEGMLWPIFCRPEAATDCKLPLRSKSRERPERVGNGPSLKGSA